MPNRIIRDWTDSYHVEPLSSDAERLFVRLIMKADDFGRYHADPRLIKAGCFPLLTVRDSDISLWITECEKAGLIVVYTASGRRYLSIIDFKQRLRESKSKFPAKDGESHDWCPCRDGPLTVTCQSNDGQSTARASIAHPNTSPSPIPDHAHACEKIPKNVEAVIERGKFIGLDESDCRDWHRDCMACRWTRGDGSPFDNWARQLVIHRDKLHERRFKNGQKRSVQNKI